MTERVRCYLVQVSTAPWAARPFCAGLIFRGEWCIEAAPILKWAQRKSWRHVREYCERKGWTAASVSEWWSE